MKKGLVSVFLLCAFAVVIAGCGAESKKAPDVPGNLKVSSADTSSITLTWSIVDGATGYYLYYSTTQTGPFDSSQRFAASSTTFRATSARLCTKYYFKVSAVNESGESAMSDTVSGNSQWATYLMTGAFKIVNSSGHAWTEIYYRATGTTTWSSNYLTSGTLVDVSGNAWSSFSSVSNGQSIVFYLAPGAYDFKVKTNILESAGSIPYYTYYSPVSISASEWKVGNAVSSNFTGAFYVKNTTASVITAVYVKPTGTTAWGDSVLQTNITAVTGTVVLSNVAAGSYDVKAVGSTDYVQTVSVSSMQLTTVTF